MAEQGMVWRRRFVRKGQRNRRGFSLRTGVEGGRKFRGAFNMENGHWGLGMGGGLISHRIPKLSYTGGLRFPSELAHLDLVSCP